MKKLKKLTLRQKELLSSNGYDFRQYLLERQDNKSFTFVHRETKEILILKFR